MASAERGTAALFGKFKTDVADQFRRDDAVKVAMCVGLTPAKQGEIKSAKAPGLALLNYLHEDDVITEDDIHKLCDALTHCHLKRTARIATEEFEKYKRKRESEASGEPRSTDDDTDAGRTSYDSGTLKSILQDELTRHECFELAIYFSLPDQVVNAVQESPVYVKELVETLENRTVVREGNISALLIALKDRGLLRVVNKIKEAFKHVVTCDDEGQAAIQDDGSGDSGRSQRCVCGGSSFEELKYNNELVALLCQNENCYGKWLVTPSSSATEAVTMKHSNQSLSYKPPGRLDLKNMKYEDVTDIKDLKPGDHIVFRRSIFYDHHAILVSITESLKLEVINWTSGSVSSWLSSLVTSNSDSSISIRKEVKDFPRGGVKRVVYKTEDPAELVLARAFKMWQDSGNSYSLSENNCESLATYCKSGVFYSVQGQLLNKYRPFVQKVMNSVAR